MNEAVFGDHVDDAVALRHLHSDWEVIDGLLREINVHGLFGVASIGLVGVNLNNVQFGVNNL